MLTVDALVVQFLQTPVQKADPEGCRFFEHPAQDVAAGLDANLEADSRVDAVELDQRLVEDRGDHVARQQDIDMPSQILRGGLSEVGQS